MRRRLIAAAALVLVAGCGTGSGTDGRLAVQRVAKLTTQLMNEPARADYCSADTLLIITAIGRDRTAGLAVRARLPLQSPRSFVVQPTLGSVGTATAAFRVPSGSGRLASGGTVRLQMSGTISGDFDVSVGDSAGIAVQFKGTLLHIPVRNLPPGACQDV